MGKRGGNNNKKELFHSTKPGDLSMTLRQESTGKKQHQGNLNAKTMCKLDHLKSIADWAATQASVPSLAAFFGQRLAATTEALGIRNDPSLFLCERCESVLQPGDNCTVRIEKNKTKGRSRQKKSNVTTQNNVVYTCHFCSHRNVMRGTPRGYVKDICPPKVKTLPKPKLVKSVVEEHNRLPKVTPIAEVNKVNNVALPIAAGQNIETSIPATPAPVLSLLDSKMKKRNRSSAKKVAEDARRSTAAEEEKSVQASNKRRKKTWTSLKEIAESSENNTVKKLSNLTIPFLI